MPSELDRLADVAKAAKVTEGYTKARTAKWKGFCESQDKFQSSYCRITLTCFDTLMFGDEEQNCNLMHTLIASICSGYGWRKTW